MYAAQIVTPHTQRAVDLVVDSDGFLTDHHQWSAQVAQHLADEAGLGKLNDTQWQFIDFVRDKYFRLGALPPTRNLCRKMGVQKEAVKEAFGSCRKLWQISGLPHPGEEALAYMS